MIMNNFTIFLIAIIIQLNGIFGEPSQDVDVNNLLELVLQSQNELRQVKNQEERVSSDSSDSTSSEGSRLDSQAPQTNDYLQKLLFELSKRDRPQKLDRFDTNRDYYSLNYGEQKQRQSSFEKVLEKLLAPRKKVANKVKQLPSTLLDVYSKDNRYDYGGNLNQYSKVYVILNPRAVRASKNKNKLTDLITRLVSASTVNERKERGNDKYNYRLSLPSSLYKQARRGFIERDSEEDYKPKRNRQRERGGGGGGGGGRGGSRTAIPYIGHRGDIYEKY